MEKNKAKNLVGIFCNFYPCFIKKFNVEILSRLFNAIYFSFPKFEDGRMDNEEA